MGLTIFYCFRKQLDEAYAENKILRNRLTTFSASTTTTIIEPCDNGDNEETVTIAISSATERENVESK